MQKRASANEGNQRQVTGGPAADRAYDEIKSAILSQEFSAGMHLTEVMMANRLGISRTPVREAFRRLDAEGWLEILPHQGVRVSSWSHRDIEEIFEMRVLLEAYIAKRAAARIQKEDIQRLKAHNRKMEALLTQHSAEALDQRLAANSEFHNVLIQVAGNSRLRRLLPAMIEIPVVKRTFESYTPEENRRSVAHHYEIIAALEAGDGDWAEAIMRSHILSGLHALSRQNTTSLSTHTKQGVSK